MCNITRQNSTICNGRNGVAQRRQRLRHHDILGLPALGSSRRCRCRDRIRDVLGSACFVSACILATMIASVSAQAYTPQQRIGKETNWRRLPQSRKFNRDSWQRSRKLDSSSGKSGKNGESSSSSKSGKSKSEKSSDTTPRPTCYDQTTAPPSCYDQTTTAPPTDTPSLTPTVPPTILLTISPTITASPTLSPVHSPSTTPSITASSLPSTVPSIMPTTTPSIDGTSIPSTVPSVPPSLPPSMVPSTAKSILPTLQSSSTQPSFQKSIPPTVPTETSQTPTTNNNGTTPIPTYSPTTSSEPVESNVPTTVVETFSPTAKVIIDTRQDLKMSLFGLPNTFLDPSQQQYYQLRTAAYIEDFYNNDDGTNGILEAIKSEITNVTAILTIESQEYEDGGGLEGQVRMIPIDEDDESYLPEFAVTNYYHRRHSINRLLQASTQVTEPCQGTSSLKITFSLELTYQKTNVYEVDTDEVIFFPFSAVEFRTTYIDNYLKNPQSGDGDAGSVFVNVYCTSRVVEGTAPTYSPSIPSGGITSSPSLLSSEQPSTDQPASLAPTVFGLSSNPSTKVPNGSSLPSSSSPLSISSLGPTSGVGSLGPSLSTSPPSNLNSGSPTTISPSSQLSVGSTGPTLTPKPTILNGSPGPNLSSRPSSLKGSNTPTVLQTSPGPSSPKPTVLSSLISGAPSTRSPSVNSTEASPAPSTSSVTTDDIFIDNISSSSPPSAISLNSTEPVTDDIFVDLRMSRHGLNERKCNSKMPTEGLEEFELSFMYGIESSSNDVYEITDDMENLILDFVASTVLVCASEPDFQTMQRSKRLDGGINESGAFRIRYPEYGEITSISDCDPSMPSQRKSCAILNTKLLVTSAGDSTSIVHHTILSALATALDENKFKESIPDLTMTYYLGPDPESLTLAASLATSMISAGGTTTKPMIAISIGCSLLLLIVALLLVFRRTSMSANAKDSLRFSRRQHKPISTCEEELDKASVGIPSSNTDR